VIRLVDSEPLEQFLVLLGLWHKPVQLQRAAQRERCVRQERHGADDIVDDHMLRWLVADEAQTRQGLTSSPGSRTPRGSLVA
jgi:hypothetical protein